MILKVNNQEVTLVQVTSTQTGNVIGLYLVPKDISIDEFEKEFERINDQETFDEKTPFGVQRLYAYESFLDV